MPDFLLYALIAGLSVAMITGPLGCFVVWRRMAYFGDTLAHSALLGIAMGFLFDLNLNLAVALCCLLISIALVALHRQHWVATDTLLGIMAHSSLALGLVTVSLLDSGQIDLHAYLFGDLLAISSSDLITIVSGTAVVLLLLVLLWNRLLAITVSEELAQVEGIDPGRYRLMLMLLIALVIAGAMKLVGILLITSLLIMPAAAARRLASTPERMAIIASVIGSLAVLGGVALSWELDTPAGPSIVVAALILFLALFFAPSIIKQR